MKKELLGTPLPDGPLPWILALLFVCATLFGALKVAASFFEQRGGQKGALEPIEGFVLHVGWLLWGGALIYAYPGAPAILLILLGLLVIFALDAALSRRR